MKIINKLFTNLIKLSLLTISLFNHRVYMHYMRKFLKFKGAKIIGKPKYIGARVNFDSYHKISIGDKVVISDGCHLLTHDYSLTTALIFIGEEPKTDVCFEKEIYIGNNVFIGKKSIIMPNSHISNNVIIGAGSVVRGLIPPNSIAIGNPCKVIAKIDEKTEKWKEKMIPGNIRFD